MNPYKELPNHRMWRRAVSQVDRQDFDPVVKPRFAIQSHDRIATAGSCFAQHISRKLGQIGFNHFVPEAGEAWPEAERRRRNFGVFSARFGNIYTTRQLLQLFEEAFEGRSPTDKAWARPDGRMVDPYRPQIEPDGFGTAEAVATARAEHLAHVRAMFCEADVFVFTLGLTESWQRRDDGSVFPLAPGVVAGAFNETDYQFINLSVAEVEQDLSVFLDKLKRLNPQIKVLLTVSPVPLIATFEERHVLVATTYSKSVLRVAAESMWRKYDWVDYFPSFEIITGSYNFGTYYEDDAREVNRPGVGHAMRVFTNNYVAGARQPPTAEDAGKAAAYARMQNNVVCDEEAIAQINV